MPQYEQHGCTVLFTRHQSTKVCQAFSKFWLVFWISAFRSMLRRWTSRDKYIDIKISRHNFICYYYWKFWRNLTKIGPIYKIVRVVFLPKSNARFMLIKFVNNSRHARRLSRLLKSQNNGTMEPLGVNDDI